MTTPDEPTREVTAASDTGWPSAPADEPAFPSPTAETAAADLDPAEPPETSDVSDAEEEGWPAPPEPEVAADWTPEAEPELFAPEEPAEPEAAADSTAEDWTPETEPLMAEPLLAEPPAAEAAPEPPVAEAAPAAEVAEPPALAPPAAAEERRGRVSAALVALILTTVLMAVADGFVWWQVHQHSATETARRDALEQCRDAARVLFSYDYRTLDKDFSAGRAFTTGAFGKQYAETTAKVVTPVAEQKKAVVKAEVVTAGVVRASTSTVVTIVYVNQVTTSSLAAAPKVDLSRVRMTMTKVGGHWLVSKVDAL